MCRLLKSLVLISAICSFHVSAAESLRQQVESWSAGFVAQAGGEQLHLAQEAARFYELLGFQFRWLVNDGGVMALSDEASALVAFIGDIHREGLLAQDYHFPALQAAQAQQDWLAFDLLLTDAHLTLGSHLLNGKVDVTNLNADWVANPRQRDIIQALLPDGKTGVVNALKTLRPNQARYDRLLSRLAWLADNPAPDWPVLAVSPKIEPGGVDGRLASIALRLRYWGDLADTEQVFSQFEPDLVGAVKRFQFRHGLKQDGILGKATLTQLNVTPAERARQLVANLERWRWLGEDFGHRFLLVNIADFSLTVYEAGQPVVRMPVIVGRHYRKTPVFSDKMRYLVFNPTWTVPVKLAVQDKLPDIQKDPEYLQRMGFKVYPHGSSAEVDAATIDWQSLAPRNFPYRLVQMPGPLNALGQVKFMFPNRYDVYLHDTPARELFKEEDRAFSSGCIRVADPMALAEYLLADQGVDRSTITQWLEAGEIKTVNLKEALPIHIEYWTAWVDREGALHFRKDVYNRDAPLIAALAQPLTGQVPVQDAP